MRAKVLTVTIKDCDTSYFRPSGSGGQHRDKTSNGVLIRHRPSGATGRASDSRSQLANKRAAFRKMAESEAFRGWVRVEHARRAGEIDAWVKSQMRPENIKVEYGPFSN